MRFLARFLVASLVVGCSTVLLGQDRHLSNEPASTLYARSAFAHGYIHGYESGFHSGDLDLQLGRDARDPSSIATFKHSGVEFHNSFGSKHSFKRGFENGFRAGYSDAIHGLSFAGVKMCRKAADGLTRPAGTAGALFDSGFRDGYEHGRKQGGEDGRSAVVSNAIEPPCLGLDPRYCDGYARAFQIGYDDAYQNQRLNHPQARKLEAAAGR